MSVVPTGIERKSESEIQIDWSDGERRVYRITELRDQCPCATCREKRTAASQQVDLLPVLSHAETLPTQITGMRPVGNYAYNIQFNDGHDTGIFTFDFLRSRGEITSGTIGN